MTFNPVIAEVICERIANGESVRSILAPNRGDGVPGRGDGYPGRIQFYMWLRDAASPEATQAEKDFLNYYNICKAAQVETLVEECLDIADNASDDIRFKESSNDEGDGADAYVNQNAINRAKIMINTRMWLAERLLPKKYGRVVEPPSGNTYNFLDVAALTHDQRMERLQQLMAKGLQKAESQVVEAKYEELEDKR